VAVSRAFTAAARAVWGVEKDPKHDGQCIMFPMKANLAGRVESIAYQVEPRGASAWVKWLCKRIISDLSLYLSGSPDGP
jgi:hypothetical protein